MRAAIDIGTNTVRLLVGEVNGDRVIPERYCRRITRLGGGLVSGGLAPEAIQRTLAALQEFAEILADIGVKSVRAVGTEVLRTAVNAGDFLRRVEKATGISPQIIDGEEEAFLTASGVLAAIDPRPARCLIFDIGGGSTEFILRHDGKTLLQRSLPLGVVRLAEDFAAPAQRTQQIDHLLRDFRKTLEEQDLLEQVLAPECQLVGTAGTVTTLAAMQLRMVEYDWRRINNLVLQKQDLLDLRQQLEPLSIAERERLPGMEKGRGDLILPGLQIVTAILDPFSFQQLTVSDFGLIEGILLESQ